MTKVPIEDTPALDVEQRITTIAEIMRLNGITADLVTGKLADEYQRPFEGIYFMSGDLELAHVHFISGRALDESVDVPSIVARQGLVMAGITALVIGQVVSAAHDIYDQGGDLLDERFDSLPGFNS